MKTCIALLRGINVGGHNILPMKDLREALSTIGLQNVQTYIQSGNVVFQALQGNKAFLCGEIQAIIEKDYGFVPDVQILYLEELITAISKNPFSDAADDLKMVHVYFLASALASGGFAKAEALAVPSEAYALSGKVFYLRAPDGIGRSKLAAGLEKALGVSATARNLRSVNKIMTLAANITT